jgi:hypothetical protein
MWDKACTLLPHDIYKISEKLRAKSTVYKDVLANCGFKTIEELLIFDLQYWKALPWPTKKIQCKDMSDANFYNIWCGVDNYVHKKNLGIDSQNPYHSGARDTSWISQPVLECPLCPYVCKDSTKLRKFIYKLVDVDGSNKFQLSMSEIIALRYLRILRRDEETGAIIIAAMQLWDPII